ncbi:taste receptor type 2 member 40-like [Eublepharis macularius]|uniref:Taste receptor type 2 n=1 Tax=Eublepharis macularius TaxID=481883 RepID=A0AA97KU36_EUBMA|nr:taste receptor type 2 member 40-like [Eublepharis macularius]
MLVLDLLNVFCLIVIASVTAIGVIGNGFIILANGLDWIQSKTMSPSDMILTALSLSRLLFLGLTLGIHCLFLLDVDNPQCFPDTLLLIWAFVNAVSLWMSACLAIFYCVKLVSFSRVFFVKIKLQISRLVPWLLLGSVLGPMIISVPIFFLRKCKPYCDETKVLQGNNNRTCSGNLISGLLYTAGNFPSFIIVLASSVLLIWSLRRHAQKMRQNTGSIKDSRMDVHIKAIKTLVSFVILFSASFVALVSLAVFTIPWTIVLCTIVVTAYNSGHTIILMAMNPKLKELLKRCLQDTIGRCLR